MLQLLAVTALCAAPLTTPTPREMLAERNNAAPFVADEVAAKFIGQKVRWKCIYLNAKYVEPGDTEAVRMFVRIPSEVGDPENKHGGTMFFDVRLSQHQFLKTLPKNAPLIVNATITKVDDTVIYLEKATAEIPPKEEMK